MLVHRFTYLMRKYPDFNLKYFLSNTKLFDIYLEIQYHLNLKVCPEIPFIILEDSYNIDKDDKITKSFKYTNMIRLLKDDYSKELADRINVEPKLFFEKIPDK